MIRFCSFLLLLVISCPAVSETLYSTEWSAGYAWNVPMPLSVSQSGHQDLDFTATYATRPFERPIYYALRFSWWDEHTGWALELLHHKLYLTDKPDEIQEFSISHGYNIITMNRGWNRMGFMFHLGCGVVLSHPESTVRNRKFSENKGLFGMGYYVSGPVLHASAGKRFYMGRNLFVSVEGKTVAAYTSVPVAGGDAKGPHVSFHGVVGTGYQF